MDVNKRPLKYRVLVDGAEVPGLYTREVAETMCRDEGVAMRVVDDELRKMEDWVMRMVAGGGDIKYE